MTTDNTIRIKCLKYRSWHRGWKETDLLLGKFADAHLDTMDAAMLDVYEQLLDENDADIWDWLVEKLPPTRESYHAVLSALRAFNQASIS